MPRRGSRALARLAAVLLAPGASGVDARPYTVDDLARTEAFGQVVVSPGGRWLLFERQGRADQLPYFDERASEVMRSRLYRVDLARPEPARPLLSPSAPRDPAWLFTRRRPRCDRAAVRSALDARRSDVGVGRGALVRRHA
jgi:hypothetical protein